MSSDGEDQKGNEGAARQKQNDRLDLCLLIAAGFFTTASIVWIVCGLRKWDVVVGKIHRDGLWTWQEVGVYFLSIATWFGVLVVFSYIAVLLVKLVREY